MARQGEVPELPMPSHYAHHAARGNHFKRASSTTGNSSSPSSSPPTITATIETTKMSSKKEENSNPNNNLNDNPTKVSTEATPTRLRINQKSASTRVKKGVEKRSGGRNSSANTASSFTSTAVVKKATKKASHKNGKPHTASMPRVSASIPLPNIQLIVSRKSKKPSTTTGNTTTKVTVKAPHAAQKGKAKQTATRATKEARTVLKRRSNKTNKK
ncbi:unnamed protein product [Phytomonas sp. Hart1]|nr:unnamed protein product [Phytomonas sp. Hart1]|eukprot:CCW72008.1 unnamed protein product [Phytomonas sp. isolate Hart1]